MGVQQPLHLATEGRFLAIVPAAHAARTLDLMRGSAAGESAAIIGQVHAAGAHPVTLTTTIGTTRPVDMFSGEQLPRIC